MRYTPPPVIYSCYLIDFNIGVKRKHENSSEKESVTTTTDGGMARPGIRKLGHKSKVKLAAENPATVGWLDWIRVVAPP